MYSYDNNNDYDGLLYSAHVRQTVTLLVLQHNYEQFMCIYWRYAVHSSVNNGFLSTLARG